MHIGKKIRVSRVRMEMTQEDLARKIGKTRPLISQIENTGKVKTGTLKEICKVLDIDLNDPEFHAFFEESAVYERTPKQTGKEKDVEAMERELKTLRELVEAQKEIIEHLKKRLPKKKY